MLPPELVNLVNLVNVPVWIRNLLLTELVNVHTLYIISAIKNAQIFTYPSIHDNRYERLNYTRKFYV